MQNENVEVNEKTEARMNEPNMDRGFKTKINVFDYVVLVLLSILFLIFLLCVLSFCFEGLSEYRTGNEEGAAWYFAWGIMSSPSLLIFGLPLFFKIRSILKYKKYIINNHSVFESVSANCDKEANYNENKENAENDETADMRILTCRNALLHRSKLALILDWIALVCFAILFLVVLIYHIIGSTIGIPYVLGSTNIHTFIHVNFMNCIRPLIFISIPLFFLCRSKIKNYKKKKIFSVWCCEDNRIWATVKKVDFIDYKYADDKFWVVCDIVKKENRAIYRYTSCKVKDDLLNKITPGQEIAVYFNPENPKEYYVNLEELK